MHWSFFSSHPRAGKWLIGSPRICNYKEKALLRLQQHMRALKPSCAAASTAATTTEILRMMISNLQCEYFTFVPLIEYRSNGRQLSSNWCPSSRIGNNSNLVCMYMCKLRDCLFGGLIIIHALYWSCGKRKWEVYTLHDGCECAHFDKSSRVVVLKTFSQKKEEPWETRQKMSFGVVKNVLLLLWRNDTSHLLKSHLLTLGIKR